MREKLKIKWKTKTNIKPKKQRRKINNEKSSIA